LAERAAWDFVARDGSGLKLSVVCPGLVLGPALDRDIGTSQELITLLMRGKYPAAPRWGGPVTDVRDVVAMHVAAMEIPSAVGQRFACVSDSLWAMDLSRILADQFPAYRRKLPKWELPNFVVRIGAMFDRNLASIVGDLGEMRKVSTEKAKRVLGFKFRPVQEAVVASATSLIDLGLIPRAS
jgi:dihydroflavonol-4-reductase